MDDYAAADVVCGIDVGKSFHHAFAVAGAFRFLAPVNVPCKIRTRRSSTKRVAENPSSGTRRAARRAYRLGDCQDLAMI